MRIHITTVTLLALLGGGILAAQQIKIDVSLVTVGVEVTDANDRPVTTLKKDDFEIYEDGVRQEIGSFDAVDASYNILLLFDCSSSTEADWPFLLQAMNRFRQTLRPQDRISVAQFGTGFKVLKRWFARTDPDNVTIQTYDSSCYGTDFYGALRKGIEELQPVKGRKGMIVLSDGAHQQIPYQSGKDSLNPLRFVDAANDSDFQKVVKQATGSAAVLYFVAVDTDLNPDRSGGSSVGAGGFDPNDIYNKQQIRARIERLASVSGGRVVYPEVPEDVVRLYEQVARELGSSYSLGYMPKPEKKDGAFHKIEVRLRDRSLRLRQLRDRYMAQQ
jgi:VWFA-related protein